MRLLGIPQLVCCLALLLGAVALGQNKIRIGVSTPLSADLASYGNSVREAVIMAADEINASGGVLGQKIQLIIEDNQSRADQAKTVFEKLIKRDNVVAIIGDVTSGASLAAAPVAQAAGIPMLTPTATNIQVTQQGDYVFRTCYTDEQQGTAMAKFAIDDLGAKRIAVLYNMKDPYSIGLRDSFIKYAREHGAEIVADLSYSTGDPDFRGQLTRFRRLRPDAIYAPGYYSEIGPICRQARSMGLDVPLLGSDGWDSEKTIELAGDAANNSYFTNHYSPEDTREEVQAFVAAYKNRYGRVPDGLAILGYDAMRILADAISRAGSTDGKAIRDALAATRNFPAASGTITINADRNADKPIVVIAIKDRQFRFQKAVTVD